MIESRVFFSLVTVLMLFWMPYDFVATVALAHVLLMISIGASSTIPLIISFIFCFIVGLVKTTKDPRWFMVLVNYVMFYIKRPSLMFRNNISYVA